jgi:putative ABC transport system substrate-binding protein
MRLIGLAIVLTFSLVLAPPPAEAQRAKVYRVGVIFQGGEWDAVLDGLRDGLRELGLEEGQHIVLELRDTKGDLKAVDEAARNLQRDKVDLLYTVATSVTIAARRATTDIPIVFVAGADPVAVGLADSFAKPGGRFTGVHFQQTDLTAKRLEMLKEILPKLRRVVTFYNPGLPVSREAARLGREAAQRLRVEFVERHVASVAELQAGLQALKVKEADALFFVSDFIVLAHAQLINDTARAKRLPTMFWDRSSIVKGGLASYGVSMHEAGRLSARYVQRILAGSSPKDLAVESVHKLELVINLRTARAIGVTIPPELLRRADQVIE